MPPTDPAPTDPAPTGPASTDPAPASLPPLPDTLVPHLHAGLYLRETRLPPHDGTGYFRAQYVLTEPLFFAVLRDGQSARVFRAVYLLIPVWGFQNQTGNRVVGYQVMDRGHPGPGPLEEWNTLPAPGVHVVFADSLQALAGALDDPGPPV